MHEMRIISTHGMRIIGAHGMKIIGAHGMRIIGAHEMKIIGVHGRIIGNLRYCRNLAPINALRFFVSSVK